MLVTHALKSTLMCRKHDEIVIHQHRGNDPRRWQQTSIVTNHQRYNVQVPRCSGRYRKRASTAIVCVPLDKDRRGYSQRMVVVVVVIGCGDMRPFNRVPKACRAHRGDNLHDPCILREVPRQRNN